MLPTNDFDFGASIKNQTTNIGKKVIYTLPKNPMDKCTIVSIYPRDLEATFSTVFPGRYVIPKGSPDNPSFLVIESGSTFLASTLERMPPTEIQHSSYMLAKSIIDDTIPTMNLSGSTQGPGVFWVYGEFRSLAELKDYKHRDNGLSFAAMLDNAKLRQTKYWTAVIDEADYLWANGQGNPRVIPQDAKMAAEILGMSKTKPWMATSIALDLKPCKACGEMINYIYPVCKFCHAVIDTKKAKDLDIQFADK